MLSLSRGCPPQIQLGSAEEHCERSGGSRQSLVVYDAFSVENHVLKVALLQKVPLWRTVLFPAVPMLSEIVIHLS